MTPNERMLTRLRDLGLSLPAAAEIRRTYAGRVQRQEGAWSWHVEPCDGATFDGKPVSDVGSQLAVGVCLRVPLTLDRDRFGLVHVEPDCLISEIPSGR